MKLHDHRVPFLAARPLAAEAHHCLNPNNPDQVVLVDVRRKLGSDEKSARSQ
jgi:hypothetical protein